MEPLIDWLMAGDVSLQYLTGKYLLNMPEAERVAEEINAFMMGTREI